jgi:hypothetical protein
MLRFFRTLSGYRSELLRWSLWYPLFPSIRAARLLHLVPLLPGGGGILDNSFPEWHSEILRRSGFSGAATLLPGGDGILSIFY